MSNYHPPPPESLIGALQDPLPWPYGKGRAAKILRNRANIMTATIKAITLHRPWGHAIAYRGKDIENRSWECSLKVGDYLAIHSGKTWDYCGVSAIDRLDPGELPTEKTDPIGIIAVARFGGNIKSSDSPWFLGPIGWQLTDVVAISPVSCSGQRGLWDLPDELLRCVRVNYRLARMDKG